MTYTKYYDPWEDSPDGIIPSQTPIIAAALDHIEAGIEAAAAVPAAHAATHKTAGADAIRLDELAAPAAAVALNSQKITGLATPTAATDAATKGYADALASGLDVKASVRAATTANITLSGTQTIDGVVLIAADRVLVKNQTTAANNGIYAVAAGVWSRTTDADVTGEVNAGMYTFIEEGTAAADTGWVLATNNPITLGTTALAFTQFSSIAANSGHIIEDEGSALTARANLNFVGAGVTAADSGGKTVVTVTGASATDLDNSLAWRLNGTHALGATTINLKSAPVAVGANQGFIILDPYTSEAEIRKVTAVGSTSFTCAALTYAHADNDPVLWWDRGLVPWTFWGAKSGNTSFSAGNVLAFNRLTTQLYGLQTFYYGGIFCPPGAWWIDNELHLERDQTFEGANVMNSKIYAAASFPFSAGNDNIAMFRPQRDGTVISTANNFSGRWGLRNIWFDGNLVANANGINSSPQQPDVWEDVRIDQCAGYAIYLYDVQQHVMRNIEIGKCGYGMRLAGSKFLYFSEINIEESITCGICFEDMVVGGPTPNFNNSIIGMHQEERAGDPAIKQVWLKSATPGLMIENWWASNNTGSTLLKVDSGAAGSSYNLRTVRCYDANGIFIDDAERGFTGADVITGDRFHANGWLPDTSAPYIAFGGTDTPQGSASRVVLGPSKAIQTSGMGGSSSGFPTVRDFQFASSANDIFNEYQDASGNIVYRKKYDGSTLIGAGGSYIKKVTSATAPLDFGSIAAHTTATLTVAVTGAVVGDVAHASPSTTIETGLSWSAYVSSSGVVTIVLANITTGAINPASRTWRVEVVGF